MARLKRLAFADLPESPTPFHYYSELTVRERRFVDDYVTHLDPHRAAKAAGYGNPIPAYQDLLRDDRVRCAIRERRDAVSQLAGVTAADVRRDLKAIADADPTEICGVHIVPCRHCHGNNGQYQYTDAEMYYLEQAHSYGEEGWPFSCVTSEYGPELYRHAQAAYLAGKRHRDFDMKGGPGYTRNEEVNPECYQCHGRGLPVAYIADTRTLSDGARKLLKGIRFQDNKFELLTINKDNVMNILARDNNVGVERKELVVTLPRTPEEFKKALEQMPVTELEEFVSNMMTLDEGSGYTNITGEEVQAELSPPDDKPVGFVRRSAPRA